MGEFYWPNQLYIWKKNKKWQRNSDYKIHVQYMMHMAGRQAWKRCKTNSWENLPLWDTVLAENVSAVKWDRNVHFFLAYGTKITSCNYLHQFHDMWVYREFCCFWITMKFIHSVITGKKVKMHRNRDKWKIFDNYGSCSIQH